MLGNGIASTSGRSAAFRGAAPRAPARAPRAPAPAAAAAAARRARLAPPRAALGEAPLVPVMAKGEMSAYPDQPGVYAVYDAAGELQYIGLTRKVSASVANHMQALPELTHSVRCEVIADGGRDALTAAWKAWMEQAIADSGAVPPGNAPGETRWQGRPVRAKTEIKLTAGKAINVPIENLIDGVVKENRIVAFVKGTRSQPQCGFSYKMLQTLNDLKADYEVVNVLDDFHNPGLRDAIKSYSQWPTIPQLYVGGEFVGGADIVEQMLGTGELQLMLRKE
ncbi:hypothetical protein Rsub_09685 [Raphidocelis subcapitata]|uniref:Glutaredoxin domain-containing protein n=1 Tax=Raphidocelis subcapitata TaxID=307507 RepID=A0A2V0PBC6_9CHLO|nr:hypothetical protein Rsub_09685 [Raphidocelis subcapitata]|eukprot:GBF96829.1 hypothetical protein Rsub_09685 [Raphidocelis subcapitata]